MASTHIDIQKSIQRKWLTKPLDWFSLFETIFFCFLACAMIFAGISLIIITKNPNANERPFVYFFLPVAILLSLYAAYRKIFENRLLIVFTGLPKEKAKKRLIDFIGSQPYDRVTHHGYILFAMEYRELRMNETKVTTFIITDNEILFNKVRMDYRLNAPVLFSHLFLKRRLRKFFGKP